MANQAFDPENPVYPQGYHVVPLPDKMTFRVGNTDNKSEMNFNKFMYFTKKSAVGAQPIVSDKTLRDIILSPESPWEDKLKGMVMIGPHGEVLPAHLSNLVDIISKIDLVEVFNLLNSKDGADVTYNTKEIGEIIPIFLEKIIDPKSKISVRGPVYPLTVRKIRTKFACYSDAFQVLYLHAFISEINVFACSGRFSIDPFVRHMDITLESKFEIGQKAFVLGSSIVMWNARGMTHASFKSNVTEIITVHNPIFLIITEARVYRDSFEEVVKVFEYEINWCLDECVGLAGGVAVIWDERKVKADDFMVTATADCPIRLLGCLKAVKAQATEAQDAEAQA